MVSFVQALNRFEYLIVPVVLCYDILCFFMGFLCNLLFKPTMLCFSANMCKHKEALAHIDSKEHLAGLGKDILADNSALRALHRPE